MKKKLIISVAVCILITGMLAGGVFYLVKNSEDNKDNKPTSGQTNVESQNIVSAINSGPEQFSSYMVENEITIAEINRSGSTNYTVNLMDLLSNTNVTFAEATSDQKSTLTASMKNLPEYDDVLVSSDGTIYLLIKTTNEKVSAVYFYKIIIDSTENTVDESPTNPVVKSLKLDTWEYYLEKKGSKMYHEASDPIAMQFVITSSGLIGSSCELTTISNNQTTHTESFLLDTKMYYTENFPITDGSYQTNLKCSYQGKDYKDSETYEIITVKGSVCDNQSFSITNGDFTTSEVNSKLVGQWEGCSSNPWTKPYQVKFNFAADGGYISQNTEKVTNPTTKRTNVALYYGTDKDIAEKTYSISNKLSTGEFSGKINICDGYGNNIMSEIRSMKMSADGNTLYFEVLYRGYGPMKYILTRVNP